MLSLLNYKEISYQQPKTLFLSANSSGIAYSTQHTQIQHLALNVLALRGDTVLNELIEILNPPAVKYRNKEKVEYNSFIARFEIDEDILSAGVENLIKESHSGLLFPNPTTGEVTIAFNKSSNGKLIVTNLLGQLLFEEKVNGFSHKLDLSSLKSSLYFITFLEQDRTGIQTFKVLKQ